MVLKWLSAQLRLSRTKLGLFGSDSFYFFRIQRDLTPVLKCRQPFSGLRLADHWLTRMDFWMLPYEIASDSTKALPRAPHRLISLWDRRTHRREKQIEHWTELLKDARIIKDLWRNKTMHTRGDYDAKQAEIVFDHVHGFMQKLAVSNQT